MSWVSLEEGGENARVLMDFEMCHRYLWCCLEACMSFGELTGTTESHFPLGKMKFPLCLT